MSSHPHRAQRPIAPDDAVTAPNAMDSLRAEDVSIETADVTSPIDDTEGSESPTESRRGKNKSDETQASSIDSQEVTKTEPPAARPPHFQEPSKDEAAMFYQWLPSQPILLGRTSSLSLPWDNAMAAPRRGAWNYGKEDTSMSCGPVGAHPIREHWDNDSFRDLLSDAFNELPYSSMVPVRVGRTIMPANERPVVLWVGVANAEAVRATWPVISHCLSLVRSVLDSEQLFDVECELRISDNMRAVEADARYTLPSVDQIRRRYSTEECVSERAISTTVGTGISPQNAPHMEGTLGLYLGPVSGSSETANPVWALTCHHVVYPEEDDTTKYNRAKIVMPSRTELNSALQNINSVITNAWHLVNGHRGPPDAQNIVDRQVLERATKLREKLTSFRASDNAAVVGHVHRAPDVAVNDHPGEPRYTRDWALIALDRAKFPDNFDFQNYVDLKADRPGSILGSINEYLDGPDRFIMPTNELMRLSGTVTLDKIRGRPKQHALVATRDDDSYFVVLKRGVKTGLTVGVALDMRSVCRQSIGTEMVESFEWLVVHISAKRFDARWPLENVFSSEGDSGAAVFDLQGRVAGMITGGTARSERAVTGMDFTYITPMAHLLADIERELGFEVKIL